MKNVTRPRKTHDGPRFVRRSECVKGRVNPTNPSPPRINQRHEEEGKKTGKLIITGQMNLPRSTHDKEDVNP